MKSFSKRAISLFLSALMVVTAIPTFAVTASAKTSTEWTVAASSDFTKSTWVSTGSFVSDLGNPLRTDGATATTSAGGSAMTWSAYEWTNTYINTNSSGINLNDGVIYLSGTESGSVPIAGASAFKIDIKFGFSGDYSITTRNKGTGPIFLKLATNGNLDFQRGNPWSNTFFTQEGYGRTHNQLATDVVSGSEGGKYRISTDNYTIGQQYHYIFTYEDNMISQKITNDNGDILVNYGAYEGSFNSSAIKGMYIGSADGYYYKNFTVSSVEMYTGVTTTVEGPQKYVDADKDKYLMAYFTGNSTEGETLHYAVSNDGMNWEALNGNSPIWDSSKLTGAEVSYPNNSGIAATGHVRDPYVFRAKDGTFYVLATDLNTENGTNWGNNSKLLVWHLNNLEDLSTTNPWYIDTMTIMQDAGVTDYVSRAWAPEAIWDEEAGHYMLFWGCGYVDGHTYMYYSYTDDFKTLLTKPTQLLNAGHDYIDGNITFDGNKYYLWYKDESNSAIGYRVSKHANGPYGSFTKFVDSDYSSSFEGPEVYQLSSTGSYILMADHYQSNTSFFAAYTSTDPVNFMNNQITAQTNLNYLNPRHGSVINITTDEYNRLIAKFGKVTFASTGVDEGKTTNDYLVARYFTSNDPTYDATGNGNTLTNSGVTMTQDYNGKVAAHFTGTASDSTSSASASTMADSYNKNGSYASVNTTEMFKDINLIDGVTFSWYGYAENANAGRWFDWSTASEPGRVSWDNELGTGLSQSNNSYIYSASNMEFGANNHGATAIANGYKGTGYKGAWHLYTYTVSNQYITFSVDGELLKYVYAKNGESISKVGCPIRLDSMNNDFINEAKTANLYFGISSYAADGMLNGYISDFRIYNKALSVYDVDESIEELNNYYPNNSLGDSNRSYYDPMETTTVDEVNYTSYGDKTVTDTVHGNVLNISGGQVSNYSYNSSATDSSKGYSISMWYNPGDAIESNTIFSIGRLNSDNGSNRHYFELLEDGHMYYNWEVDGTAAYFDIDNEKSSFASSSLPLNEWTHIVIQVEPYSSYDKIYIYFNGSLINIINTYTFDGIRQGANLDTGRSVHDFLAMTTSTGDTNSHTVRYGTGCDYWGGATGTMDDFAIYNGLYGANDIYKKDCQAIADTLLPLGVDHYKEAMAELKDKDYVYTNMAYAYECYDKVCRYLDATNVEKGKTQVNPGEIVELYNELERAIEAMGKYSKPATIQGYDEQDKNFIDEKYTHNMLTAPTGVYTGIQEQDIRSGQSQATYDSFNSRISSSNFVWLYTGITGDTPIAPYSVGAYSPGKIGTTMRMQALYITNDVPMQFGGAGLYSDSTKDNCWHMNDYGDATGGNNPNWLYETYTNYTERNVKTVAGYDANYRTGKLTSNKWANGSGYAQFTGTLNNFVTDTTDGSIPVHIVNGQKYRYLIEFTPTYASQKTWGDGSSKMNDGGFWASGTGTVRVINYATVKSALLDTDRVAKLANITLYTPASCKELLSAYDALTSEKYTLEGVAQAYTLAETLEEKVNNLENVDLTKIQQKADDTGIVEAAKTHNDFIEMAATGETVIDGVNVVEAIQTDANGDPVLDSEGNPIPILDDGKPVYYTTSSWASYQHAYERLTEYFANLNPYTGATGGDQPYATSQAQLDTIKNNVNKAFASLQYAADYSQAEGIVDVSSKTYADKSTKNMGANGQIYTYDSFLAFGNAYNEADYWASKSADYKADTEKYAIGYIKEFDRDGIHYSTGPYIAYDVNGNIVTSDEQVIDSYKFLGVFYDNADDEHPSQFETGDYVKIDGVTTKLNGHRYYVDSSTLGTKELSSRQKSITKSAEDSIATDEALTVVDTPEAYETFDASVEVLSVYDDNKYTDAGIAAINNAISSRTNEVYVSLTAEQANAYIKAGGTYKTGDLLKRTTTGATDPITAGALNDYTAINAVDSNIMKYTAKFVVQDVDGNIVSSETSQTLPYGSEFTILTTDDSNGVKWTVTNYGKSNFANALGSTKFGYGPTITRIADANIYVTAVVGGSATESTTVYVKNVYGRVVQVIYVADISSFDTSAIDVNTTVPFYDFVGWNSPRSNGDGTYTVTPNYTPVVTNNVTVNGGEISGNATISGNTASAVYDTKLTIRYTGADTFTAWAALCNGRYQIASYNSTYTFHVAPCDEVFYPVIEENGSFYVVDGDVKTLLTSANVESAPQTSIDANKLLNDKLTQKLPFVSIITKQVIDGKTRAYARVTDGAVSVEGYGVKFTKDGVDYTRAINNVLDNGQFTITIGSTNVPSIIATVTYQYQYSAVGETTNVSIVDYSRNA